MRLGADGRNFVACGIRAMGDTMTSLGAGALLIITLAAVFFAWRRRRLRDRRQLGQLFKDYFRGGMSIDQLGQRARELVGRQVLPSAELQSLATAAFQSAVDEKLGPNRSTADERRLLTSLADLKNEFGLPDRYRIEGWRAGRE